MLDLFERLAREFPFWNATREREAGGGPPSHFLISPCDHGPGDCMFERGVHPDLDHEDAASVALRRGAPRLVRWDEIDPTRSSRRLAFLMLNGDQGHVTRFRQGHDIRLPASDSHQCGPYCGIGHRLLDRLRVARRILRRYSPWTGRPPHAWPPGSHARSTSCDGAHARSVRGRPDGGACAATPPPPPLHPSLYGRRAHRLFFAGRVTKGGARGDLFNNHQQVHARMAIHASLVLPYT